MITSVIGSAMACFLAALSAQTAAPQQVPPKISAARPVLMVLVRERFEQRVSGTRTAETCLTRLLRDKGFPVVDPDQKKLLDLRSRLLAQTAGDTPAAIRAVTDFAADYVLAGEAAVSSGSPLGDTDLRVRSAGVSLRIIESNSGRILAVASAEAKVKHFDELAGGNWALQDATEKAAAVILADLDKLQQSQTSSQAVPAASGNASQLRDAVPDLQQRYLAEKYNHSDMENARQADKDLAIKTGQLAAVRQLGDDRRKQLQARTEELRQTQAQAHDLETQLESIQRTTPAAD